MTQVHIWNDSRRFQTEQFQCIFMIYSSSFLYIGDCAATAVRLLNILKIMKIAL